MEKKLGEGGCGQVYLVVRSRDKRQFALKTEYKHADESTRRLKVVSPKTQQVKCRRS